MEGHGQGGGTCFPLPLLAAAAAFVVISTARVLYVLYRTGRSLRASESTQRVSTLIIFGSGGHTAEMLNLLAVFDKDRFAPRYYIAAVTDDMSLQKARVFEESLAQREARGDEVKPAHFMKIYRSREVGQSYLTSIGTTVIAITHALWIALKIRPQVASLVL